MNRNLGAQLDKKGHCEFTVWAPLVKNMSLEIVEPFHRSIPLQKDNWGYWTTEVKDIKSGTLYFYKINKELLRPDPASQSQPQSVHGPSEVVLHDFSWSDHSWQGLPLKKMVLYELHIGTFTTEGTFESIIPKLDYFLELGVNAVEIMPISQFPGNRNWGYDGVFPFAAQNSYGGVTGLKKLINACHQKGIAVLLDVVYNHFGPEGNYLNDFAPYFTNKYCTPWGKALNFDDEHSDEVRNFFIQNALMWFRDFHIDGLRLDAVHAIKDLSAKHFLRELSQHVKTLGRQLNRELILIAECDLNDPRFINLREEGGFGLDGQWIDEFHHSLHSLVTGEKDGYYADFGSLEDLRKAFVDSFVYTGQYSVHRKRSFGAYPEKNPYSQFIVFAQNHDQVGNRMLGERLSKLVSYEALKLMAACYLVSPYVPMLFMGEEFGEENPFMYFISHTDKALVEAVRQGRKKEFEYFNWKGEVPDPQSEETFNHCKINWDFKKDQKKMVLFNLYKQLIHFRKTNPAFQIDQRGTLTVETNESKGTILMERWDKPVESGGRPLFFALFNYKEETSLQAPLSSEKWTKFLDSAEEKWLGPGNTNDDQLKGGEKLLIKKHSIIIYENRLAEP